MPSKQDLSPAATTTAPISGTAKATTWDFDPAHSSAEFAVRHMMISTVTGRFKTLRGSVLLDEAHPEHSHVEADIEVASIDTGIAQRDEHLRSPDFFDAASHPLLTFRSRRVDRTDAQEARVAGDLTIRGVTRPVTLAVERLGETTDPWGNRRAGFAASASIDRKDFGLTWNQLLEAGGVVVGDKVKITLNVEAVRRTGPAAQVNNGGGA